MFFSSKRSRSFYSFVLFIWFRTFIYGESGSLGYPVVSERSYLVFLGIEFSFIFHKSSYQINWLGLCQLRSWTEKLSVLVVPELLIGKTQCKICCFTRSKNLLLDIDLSCDETFARHVNSLYFDATCQDFDIRYIY